MAMMMSRLPLALATGALLALAGCVLPQGAPPATAEERAASAGQTPVRRMPVQGGALIAVVPSGYCFDRAASRDDADGTVMVAGRCKARGAPAVISVSIGRPGSSDVLQSGGRALNDWFTSRAGRAALARDGRAGSVAVRKTAVADGAFVLLVQDRNAGTYWRAVLGLNSHLVSVSVGAPTGAELDEVAARKVLDATVTALRNAN